MMLWTITGELRPRAHIQSGWQLIHQASIERCFSEEYTRATAGWGYVGSTYHRCHGEEVLLQLYGIHVYEYDVYNNAWYSLAASSLAALGLWVTSPWPTGLWAEEAKECVAPVSAQLSSYYAMISASSGRITNSFNEWIDHRSIAYHFTRHRWVVDCTRITSISLWKSNLLHI